MLKQVLHKVFSIAMAILVLFSTVSFTVESHYCGDTLVDVSIFADANKCAMESMEMLQKKTCCKDEVDVIQGQDELNVVSFKDFDLDQQQFLVAFAQSYLNLFESLPKQIIPHKDYVPPNLIYDIQVLDEVFLI